jgi:hypothetical protein
MGAATVTGAYADIYSAGWVGYLRQTLASDCVALGIEDLDDSVLQRGEPRRLTQLASLKVNEAGLDGIYYRSRYGHDLENWALFEPFKINPYEAPIVVRPDDVDLQDACTLLGLKIERP